MLSCIFSAPFSQTVDFELLMKARTSGRAADIVEACIILHKERIASLVRRVRDSSVEIVLRLASVALTSPDVVKEIRALRPWTISWSNVLDYITPFDFHALARACSADEDTTHFMYSMNWQQDVKGELGIENDIHLLNWCADYFKRPGEDTSSRGRARVWSTLHNIFQPP